jgi:hypothetical protein
MKNSLCFLVFPVPSKLHFVGKQPFKLCFIILCCVSKTYELSIHEVQLRGYGGIKNQM